MPHDKTKKPPLVSVVIPTYNRESTIRRAIDSALNQTYKPLEIIVADDMSDDRTEEVMEVYAGRENVRYIRLREKAGGGGARNVGIASAKGEYIAFLDSDDEWLPDKLSKQLTLFDKHPETGVVFCQMERVYPSGNTVFPDIVPGDIPPADFFTSLIRENKVGTPTAVVRKDLLDRVEGFDASLPRLQDWDLFLRLSLLTEFRMVPEPLCRVYMQPDSITKNSAALQIAIEKIKNKFEKQISRLPDRDKAGVYENFGSLYILSGLPAPARREFFHSLQFGFTSKRLVKYLISILPGATKMYHLLGGGH